MSTLLQLPAFPPDTSDATKKPTTTTSNLVNTLREDIEECLTEIKTKGSFAVFKALANAPNTGLRLENGGHIGLPWSKRGAAAVIAASHKTPFGKGRRTVVYTAVRDTGEISSNDFNVTNPAWDSFLQSIVTKVSARLGINTTGKGVQAQNYKVLLYDKGAMFKPHQE